MEVTGDQLTGNLIDIENGASLTSSFRDLIRGWRLQVPTIFRQGLKKTSAQSENIIDTMVIFRRLFATLLHFLFCIQWISGLEYVSAVYLMAHSFESSYLIYNLFPGLIRKMPKGNDRLRQVRNIHERVIKQGPLIKSKNAPHIIGPAVVDEVLLFAQIIAEQRTLFFCRICEEDVDGAFKDHGCFLKLKTKFNFKETTDSENKDAEESE